MVSILPSSIRRYRRAQCGCLRVNRCALMKRVPVTGSEQTFNDAFQRIEERRTKVSSGKLGGTSTNILSDGIRDRVDATSDTNGLGWVLPSTESRPGTLVQSFIVRPKGISIVMVLIDR
jgi:hypothetical protein